MENRVHFPFSEKMKFALRNNFLWSMLLCSSYFLCGQQVAIINHTVNSKGQVELEVQSNTNHYYLLKVRHDPTTEFELFSSLTIGQEGKTIITEPVGNYSLEHYQVLEYSMETPEDVDDDGFNDVDEFQNIPFQSPFNAAVPIDEDDGLLAIDNFKSFKGLSITDDHVQWSEFLNGKVHVKYLITDFHTSSPKIYFIDSDAHEFHADFAEKVGVESLGDQVKKGQVIYHPATISNNGTLGTFAFNYSNGNGQDFKVVQRTFELLAANMPFLTNNFSYYITALNADEYERDLAHFQTSRIPVLFESDVYAEVDYLGLNREEGYGFFRHMNLTDIPSATDIVLYDALPNTLPRVGGIITSVLQTPLSHVNLRAIQDQIPNSYIRNPLSVDSIAELLDHYIYYKVEQDHYFIREASIEEVNEWYDDLRPTEEQTLNLNFEYRSILPLADITFDMADGFGSKCTNVAVMRTLGFPEETIPDGFGVPFYFYYEFMKYNQLFEEVEIMIGDRDFIADREIRAERLKDLRERIRKAKIPPWMLKDLEQMQQSFPDGTSIRCRSSSNNEDLPGFSGAGLYTSKTQHPDEGHISKSIKQVYAGLWNLRAFEEREFFKVKHTSAAMGVLCHPNYSYEKANGVGVSIDPVYNTEETFFLNSQIGEDLITNPTNTAIPEEILLDKVRVSNNDVLIIQRSSINESDTLIMSDFYTEQMREYLTIIHNRFEELYNAQEGDQFAMDIEYKITQDHRLIIKQARPWASFIPQRDLSHVDRVSTSMQIFPNPAQGRLQVQCGDCFLKTLTLRSLDGQVLQKIETKATNKLNTTLSLHGYPSGIYMVHGVSVIDNTHYVQKLIKL